MTGPYWISNTDLSFPPVDLALSEPNGLLGVGGDLRPERIVNAYRQGIFPWYTDDQPILWWSPHPRAVLFPQQLNVSRSLRKFLKKKPYSVTIDRCFEEVLRQCAAPRKDALGTWITEEMHQAYLELHRLGIGHSIEAWQGDTLVGGLYGLALGRVFFGESMFNRATNASKTAFVTLVKQLDIWDYGLIDCQVSSAHLQTLGATEIDREKYIKLLNTHIDLPGTNAWKFDEGFDLLDIL